MTMHHTDRNDKYCTVRRTPTNLEREDRSHNRVQLLFLLALRMSNIVIPSLVDLLIDAVLDTYCIDFLGGQGLRAK